MKNSPRKILEELCHNTMGNPPYRIDQALLSLREWVMAKKKYLIDNLPKETTDNYLGEAAFVKEKINGYNQALQDIADSLTGGEK